MISFVFGVLCAAIALVGLALLKTYSHVPAKELARRARKGDSVAGLLYRAATYGASLRALLWFIIGLTLAGSVIIFAGILPAWLAVCFVALLVWVGFAWIPTTNLSSLGIRLARQLAPPIAWVLDRVQPVTGRLAGLVRRHRPITVRTGLYEKSDLVELLEKQKDQPENRIPHGEINLLQHALTFGDKQVADVLIPTRVVTFVSADEPIGPIVMEELHKSGHSRFPVYDGKEDNIVGILLMRDLLASKKSGKVGDVMRKHVSYVHEDFTLYQTLQAFIKTKQHLFLVVNAFEELVGIITIEDVIEQIVGKLIVDEFDSYDDLRQVAATAAKKEHVEHKKTDSEPSDSEV